ncbi:MAG: hypothetical protein VB855_15960 [Pirellulaceae bacterium]
MKRLFLLATIALLLASSGCCRPLLRRPLFPLLNRMPCQTTEVYGDVVVPSSGSAQIVEEVPIQP